MKIDLTKIKAFLNSRQVGPKGLALWLGALAVVLTAAILFAGMSASHDQVFPVYITEVMASNASFPNEEGRCCDYLEIYNSADYPVDLTGFQIGDIAGKSRYAFPAGTVMQPGEYRVIYCDKTVDDGAYASFEISRAGEESFYLITKSGAIADSVLTIPMDVDQAMVLENGQWLVTDLASPGGAAEKTGMENIYNAGVSAVRISEFSSGDNGYLPTYRVPCDWVELWNTSADAVDISGFTLSDNVGNDKYTFPEGTVIAGNSYLVVSCTDRVAASDVAPFGLSREHEETVVLKNEAGLIVEIVHSKPLEADAMALNADGIWAASKDLSPGYENAPSGHQTFLKTIGAESGSVLISEVMTSDQLVLPDSFGEFPDWAELHNTTGQAIDLSGWYLSDDPADLQKWMIPELVLQPGERKIVFCSGRGVNENGEVHAEFSLSAGGESLTLTSYIGNTVDSVSFPAAEAHSSFIFDDGVAVTDQPTPGYANDGAGYEAFCDAAVAKGPLAIWEVMTSNDKYLPQVLGQCYDWVELRNISDSTLDLSGFSISDDLDVPGMYELKNVKLKPGQSVIIILSDEEGAAKSGVQQAPFVLDAQEDQLFLFDPQGNLLDYVFLKNIPYGCSYGRNQETGGFSYMEPSPGNPNTAGYRLISSAPVSSHVSGVYSGEEFAVTLEAEGDIYYTTDGSVPDAGSKKYQDTLKIGKTTVLRAVAIEEGKMASDIYTATFIVGDTHEVPVVSLVTDPAGLWGPKGVYRGGDITVKEIRLPAHVSYSGEDGSFAINCAMNLHGATTVTAFEKKTFAVRFENSFDGPLHYDVFEDGEVTSFSSLLIRTAHESVYSSQMHDALIGYLASQCSDTVLSQKYKYVSLYLNGEYWGVYALRERHSQEHYASYMDVPADSVEIQRFMVDEQNDLHKLYNFCGSHSLVSDENYDYAKSILDVESFADWIIFEAYMANIDIYSNIRYYRSSVDGLWRMGLADLDLGMMGTTAAFNQVADTFSHGRVVSALMKNEDFQDLIATRLAELLAGPMSDENVIKVIERMASEMRPEAAWEAKRWQTPVRGWENTVQDMIRFVDGRAKQMINSLCKELNFTAREREKYFGHLE